MPSLLRSEITYLIHIDSKHLFFSTDPKSVSSALFSHCPTLLVQLQCEVWSTPSSLWTPMLSLQLHQRILEIYPRTLPRSTTSCWRWSSQGYWAETKCKFLFHFLLLLLLLFLIAFLILLHLFYSAGFGHEIYYDILITVGKHFIDTQQIIRAFGLGLLDPWLWRDKTMGSQYCSFPIF